MIRHIVFLKLEDNSESAKQEIKKMILALKNDILVLKNMEVGLNFSPEERAYDIVLIADFDCKEDLKTYATHPVHLKLISYLKSLNTLSKVVDYKF